MITETTEQTELKCLVWLALVGIPLSISVRKLALTDKIDNKNIHRIQGLV